jgi:RHS repeat-associated protein
VGQTPLRIDLDYNLRHEVTTITRFSDLAGTTVVGTSIYTIDDAHRLTRIDHKNGSGTALASYVYDYDDANRLTQETINATPRTFSYDRTDQLTNDGGTAYTFDANGNRTMAGYQTIVANRMSNDGTYTYTYDDAGNTIKKSKGVSDETWTYAFDHNNRLTGIEKRATDGGTLLVKGTYTYDALGNRVQDETWQTGVGTTTARYAYNDAGRVWADLDGSSALNMRYLRATGLAARVAGDGTAAWLLTDYLGSVRGVTNLGGSLIGTVAYDAYGKILSETSAAITGRFTFTGLAFDRVVELLRTPFRDREVRLNVWLQEDPLLMRDGPNPRLYVRNKPTLAVDPSGLLGIFLEGTGFDAKDKTVIHTLYEAYIDPNLGNMKAQYYTTTVGNLSDRMKQIYEELVEPALKKNPNEPIDIFGYSRGGALAIALADYIQDEWGNDKPVTFRFIGLIDPCVPITRAEDRRFVWRWESQLGNHAPQNIAFFRIWHRQADKKEAELFKQFFIVPTNSSPLFEKLKMKPTDVDLKGVGNHLQVGSRGQVGISICEWLNANGGNDFAKITKDIFKEYKDGTGMIRKEKQDEVTRQARRVIVPNPLLWDDGLRYLKLFDDFEMMQK